MAHKALIAIVAVVVAAAVGVGTFYVLGSSGTLNVQIKDPIGPGWSAVYINVSSVSVHNTTSQGKGYSVTFSKPVTVNLADATSRAIFLTSLKLPPGHYQMIRMTLTGAYGVFEGHTYKISLVNGTVDVAGQFRISAMGTTTVTLDFNSAQAIHGSPASGFTMTPVVSESVS